MADSLSYCLSGELPKGVTGFGSNAYGPSGSRQLDTAETALSCHETLDQKLSHPIQRASNIRGQRLGRSARCRIPKGSMGDF